MPNYSEQDIYDIMLMNSQGLSAREIARRRAEPYINVLDVVKNNGGVLRQGGTKSTDGSSIMEQAKILWNGGMYDINAIANTLNTSPKYILLVLNNYHGILTRKTPDKAELDNEVIEVAKRQLGGEYARGELSAIAKKHGISRQAVHQKVNKATKMLQQQAEQPPTTDLFTDFE